MKLRSVISLSCCAVISLLCSGQAQAQLAAPQIPQMGKLPGPPSSKIFRVAIVTDQVFKSKELAQEAAKNMAVMAQEVEMSNFLFRVIKAKEGFTVVLAIRIVFVNREQAEQAVAMLKQDKNYTESVKKPNFQVIEDVSY